MNKANEELRKAMKQKKVTLWMIADKMGCHESTIIRKFRHEIEGQEKDAIMKIIKSFPA